MVSILTKIEKKRRKTKAWSCLRVPVIPEHITSWFPGKRISYKKSLIFFQLWEFFPAHGLSWCDSLREAGWAPPLAAGPEPAALMGGRQAQLVGVS